MIDMLLGRSTLVVGLGECGDGQLLKVYIAARYRNLYVLVEDPAEQERVRAAWAHQGHVFTAVPPADAIEQDGRPASPDLGTGDGEGGQ